MSDPAQTRPDPAAEIYEMLMMEYASGVLDNPLCLLMASHLTLSAAARRHLAVYESVGGALIAECCQPVPMAEQSLTIVLGKLESCGEDSPCTAENIMRDAGIDLPQPLQHHMKAQACHTKKWLRAGRGVMVMPIPLSPCRIAHHALLVRAISGAAIPRPRHIAREYTLVLQGCLRRQHDYFEPGDMFVVESETMPRPVVDSHR